MVLAMPSDGLWGDGSGYLKHDALDYERWIVNDVVNAATAVLNRKTNQVRFYIAGLSMGGFGALRLMARHPALFKAASGLSSVTSVRDLLPFLAPGERNYFSKNFGEEMLITSLRRNRRRLSPFRFDCGVDDPLIESNRLLHQQLVDGGITHLYEEFPGDHSNAYWNRQIGRTLQYFDTIGKLR
jgi:S-formylglutathione hydrolase FrmB